MKISPLPPKTFFFIAATGGIVGLARYGANAGDYGFWLGLCIFFLVFGFQEVLSRRKKRMTVQDTGSRQDKNGA